MSWLSFDKMWVCRAEGIFETFFIFNNTFDLSDCFVLKISFSKLSIFFNLFLLLVFALLFLYLILTIDYLSLFQLLLENCKFFNFIILLLSKLKLLSQKWNIWRLMEALKWFKGESLLNFYLKFPLIPTSYLFIFYLTVKNVTN